MANDSTLKKFVKILLPSALMLASVIAKILKEGNSEELDNHDADLSGRSSSRNYTCPECDGTMHFADDEVLVCDVCGYSIDVDYYDEEIEERSTSYPTREEVCGWDDDEEDDEDNSERLSADDAALIWLSHGKDEDYMFGYTEEELEENL